MAFHFFKWLRARQAEPIEAAAVEADLLADGSIRELALLAVENLLGNALSKCEFRTYRGGQIVQGPEWYLWNVEPNQNQNSTAFLHQLVHELIWNRDALVIEHGGRLYVADAFTRTDYALYRHRFSQVQVCNLTFDRTFDMSDVLYFELSHCGARAVVDRLYQSYGQLIAYGMQGYRRSRGSKGVLTLDTTLAGDKQFGETYERIKNDGFRRFAEAESAVLPLYKGMGYTELGNKTYSADTTRDIRSMIDDVTDFTARGFAVPASLLNGSVQDVSSATSQFLTFCLDPLVDNLAEEINRKRYGEKAYLRGDRIEISTNNIQHVDLLSCASGVDKLLSSGVCCVNDLRALTGQPLIDEPWAWKHFLTRNYAAVEAELAGASEGGDTT